MLTRLGKPDRPLHLIMDRAYEGNETRQLALDLGYSPVVPPKSNRLEPWEYDREMYKRRNEVERLFRRLKGYRRIFRVLLAAQPQLVTPVLQVVQRVITRHLLDAAKLPADEGQSGAVTLIQRFGSAGNLNIHLHCLVLDGVYRCDADGASTFVETDAPTDDELHALLQTVISRLMKMLMRRGVLIEEMGQTYLAEPDANGEEARTLRTLQTAAITYRIAFGPRAGQKILTLRGGVPREGTPRRHLCADIDGFSLHAAVRVEAADRKRLEQLCRYITRPALSDERVHLRSKLAGREAMRLGLSDATRCMRNPHCRRGRVYGDMVGLPASGRP